MEIVNFVSRRYFSGRRDRVQLGGYKREFARPLNKVDPQ
jgi:hypothetical protein